MFLQPLPPLQVYHQAASFVLHVVNILCECGSERMQCLSGYHLVMREVVLALTGALLGKCNAVSAILTKAIE